MSTAASTDFNRIRVAFMERISGANIPPHAFKLGRLIAFQYMNRETRLAYPSQETLARDLGIETRSVRRLLDILERHGLVIASGIGRCKSSRYWIDPEKVTPESAFKTKKRTRKSGLQTTKKADSRVLRTKKRTNIGDGECLTALPHPPGESVACARRR